MEADAVLKKISSNVSRNNRFDFQLRIPNISELSTYGNKESLDIINFYIIDINIPGLTLSIKETFYLGITKFTGIKQDVDNITVQFYDTKEQFIRKFFVEWFNQISPRESLSTLKYYPNEYSTSAKLIVEKKNYEIKGMVPTSIGDFSLSQNNTSSLGTFSVIFKIKKIIDE